MTTMAVDAAININKVSIYFYTIGGSQFCLDRRVICLAIYYQAPVNGKSKFRGAIAGNYHTGETFFNRAGP